MTDPAAFRSQFPVLGRVVYLNAGTEGPVPSAAADAIRAQVDSDLTRGRVGRDYFETVLDLAARARAGYARALGAAPEDVALTSSTTGGLNAVLGGMRWEPGDEVLTSDEEHPGLLAPLRRLSVLFGVRVRIAPFASLAATAAEAVAAGPRTKLIAVSHVSWVGGQVADVPALVATGIPVLLDGAQGLGAVPVGAAATGVDFYAGSGQKWMCGPEGAGALYVRPGALHRIEPPAPGYGTVADHADVLTSPLVDGAARFDDGFPPAVRSAAALAAMGVFEGAGWDWVHARAAAGAATLAAGLAAHGLAVMPRGASTLVSWRPARGPDADTDAEVARFAAAGIIVRSIPSHGLIRASVGAWTSEEDIARLLDVAAAG